MTNILGFGGIADLIFFGGAFVVIGSVLLFPISFARRARRFGYPSTGAYLRAAPRTDAEKQDAADLMLKGVVFFVLGLLFPPFVLIALMPLFYGGRKLVYASMGLGLIDDPDQPGA